MLETIAPSGSTSTVAPAQLELPVSLYLYPSNAEDVDLCPCCYTVIHGGYCGHCDVSV